MTSRRQSKELRGNAATRAVESCLRAMDSGSVSSRHIRDVMRCEPCQEMAQFEQFIHHQDIVIRGHAAMLLAKVAPEKVVSLVLEEDTLSGMSLMLEALEEAEYKDIDGLTSLLRREDSLIVERVLQTFVKVGRADLLFGLALSGDDRTTQRIKRYLSEQGFL